MIVFEGTIVLEGAKVRGYEGTRILLSSSVATPKNQRVRLISHPRTFAPSYLRKSQRVRLISHPRTLVPSRIPASETYLAPSYPRKFRGQSVTTSSKCSLPQLIRSERMGISERAVSVSEYSTRGGTSGNTSRCTR